VEDRGLLARNAMYVGGAIGPFGASIVVPMLPELRNSFSASSEQVAGSLTAYFIPFAVLLVVSGTIGERFGRRRVVRVSLVTYAISSLACAVAPGLGLFLAARVAQGASNAFITPLLLAGLADIHPPDRLGRAVGIYGSFQAGGQVLAPVVGGLAAEVDWRLGFILPAALALLLWFTPPPGEPRPGTDRPPVAALFHRRLLMLGLASLASGAGVIGIGYLVALYSRDTLGVSPAGTGLLLMAGGGAGVVASPFLGSLVDRLGGRRAGAIGAVAAGTVVVLLGQTRSVALVTLLWAGVGASAGLIRISQQRLAVGLVPRNRGGAVSSVLSLRFAGHAMSPILWTSLLARDARLDFLAVGLTAVLVVVLFGAMGPVGNLSEEQSGEGFELTD